MKKIFLSIILTISFALYSCTSYNIVTKNGYPTQETLQKELQEELQGRHNYTFNIKPDAYAPFIRGSKNNLTINEMIYFLLPYVITMSDVDTYAVATIIDPVTTLESLDSVAIQPYYRNNNIVGLRVAFACERQNEEYKTAYKHLVGITYMEYNSNTNKLIKENIPQEEANQKRSILLSDRYKAEGYI
jgi:hypothetical protein